MTVPNIQALLKNRYDFSEVGDLMLVYTSIRHKNIDFENPHLSVQYIIPVYYRKFYRHRDLKYTNGHRKTVMFIYNVGIKRMFIYVQTHFIKIVGIIKYVLNPIF